jgi:hypothetical protein
MAFWWCLKHGRVEEASALGWFHGQRLGPFDSAEAAGRALETIHARGERQDAEDEAWNEGRTDGS